MQSETIIPVDPQSWDSQYRTYLQKVAFSKINDPDEVCDLVQDTFLAGLERLEHFKGNSSERTWLTSILLHKIMDRYRKQSMEIEKQPQIIKAQIDQQTRHSNEELLIHKELMGSLRRSLGKMPRLWSAVFKLKYLEETPTNLICVQLGITAANFWTITHRSKLQLRALMQ